MIYYCMFTEEARDLDIIYDEVMSEQQTKDPNHVKPGFLLFTMVEINGTTIMASAENDTFLSCLGRK